MTSVFKSASIGSVLICILGMAAAPRPAFSEQSLHRGPPSTMIDVELVRDLRRQLEQAEAEERFSGAVILAKHGRPLFLEAYGPANRAFGAVNDVNTKFNLASVAKMFTATAILQLAGEGRLSLEDPLISVLPDYPNREVASQVTIAQLLAMTSGMGDYANAALGQTNWLRLQTIEDYLPFFANDPLRFPPGSRFGYSNAGFMTLGLVIERLSGQSYRDYVRTRIFEPTEMKHTGYFTSEDDIPNLALGYTRSPLMKDSPLLVALRIGRGAEPAGGSGTYTTVADMLRFAEAIRRGRLLTPEYTDLLMTYRPSPFPHDYGWRHSLTNGVYSVGHGGATSGTSTGMFIYPQLGYTFAVLSNYDGASDLVGGRLKFRLTGQVEPRAFPLPHPVLQQFAGAYVTPPAGPGGVPETLYLTVERGSLFVQMPRQGIHKFVPMSANEFFDIDMLSPRLVFSRNASGQVVSLTLSGIGEGATTANRKL